MSSKEQQGSSRVVISLCSVQFWILRGGTTCMTGANRGLILNLRLAAAWLSSVNTEDY